MEEEPDAVRDLLSTLCLVENVKKNIEIFLFLSSFRFVE